MYTRFFVQRQQVRALGEVDAKIRYLSSAESRSDSIGTYFTAGILTRQKVCCVSEVESGNYLIKRCAME